MDTPLIDLTGIHFAYDAGRPVLSGASLRLSAGERVAVTGPNGSGKSTLFLITVGLLQPSAGTVHAFGRLRQTEADFAEIRPRCGLVFQDPDDQLFCPTVAEDIAFGPLNQGKTPAEALAIVAQTLSLLGLTGFGDRITHKLSGGEKRLVSLATVLAMQPDVLLLDEPTNGLDVATRERLIDILTDLPQAMVVISHDPDFLDRVATRRVRLEDGQMAAEDPDCTHTSDRHLSG